jgi:hypothetical protein
LRFRVKKSKGPLSSVEADEGGPPPNRPSPIAARRVPPLGRRRQYAMAIVTHPARKIIGSYSGARWARNLLLMGARTRFSVMARHPLSFSVGPFGQKPPKREARPKLDPEFIRAIEESLADPRPNLSAKDVHDRLARRHEARLKRDT